MLIRFNIFNNTLCKECSKRLEKDYKYEPWRKHYIVDSDDWLAQEINNNKNSYLFFVYINISPLGLMNASVAQLASAAAL